MELLDVYNDNGQRTGKVIEKTNKVKEESELLPGEHIAVSIIYIENSNGEFLMQKTSKEKGGKYSSTGGHVDHGEEPLETIKREVKEEIGIDIYKDNIVYLGYMSEDFPIRFMYYLKKDVDLKDVHLQEDEVGSVSYMNMEELENIINEGLMHKGHLKVLKKVLEYKENI